MSTPSITHVDSFATVELTEEDREAAVDYDEQHVGEVRERRLDRFLVLPPRDLG